jgi:beta-lactamase class A
MPTSKNPHLRYILLIILIVWAFFFGYSLWGWLKMASDNTITNVSTQKRENNTYKYISPLLECDIADWESQQKYIPFEKEIKKTIEETIIQKNPNIHLSIYFRNLNNGPWFWINEEEAFAPASLMKLPISMSYMKWSETNPGILSKMLTIRQENASTQNFIPDVGVDTWSTYSVIDLISRALIYSDNDANRTLVDNIPEDVLMSIFKDLWVPVIDRLKEWIDEYISVKEYASFFRMLYNASYLDRRSSETLLGILSESKFQDGLVKHIPASVVVSHKFGERKFQSPKTWELITELHDCGIVYYEKYPYLLCIMSKGNERIDFKELEWVIQDTSRLIFETIERLYP